MRAYCPKCGSGSAWIEYGQQDNLLRCFCGIHVLLQTTLEEVSIDHEGRVEDVSLPREGTKLWQCLLALYAIAPANTSDITLQVNLMRGERNGNIIVRRRSLLYDTNEVSSHLTVLRYKGLVMVTEFRKGLPGGSTWQVTPPASDLLAVNYMKGAH